MFADLKFKFKFKDFLNLPIQAAAIGPVSLHLKTLAWRHLSRPAPVARPETQKTVQGVDATSIHVTDAPNVFGQTMTNTQHSSRGIPTTSQSDDDDDEDDDDDDDDDDEVRQLVVATVDDTIHVYS